MDIVALVEPDKSLSMSGLNPGTVGAIVSLTIDQSQARRLGIDFFFPTCEVKSLHHARKCLHVSKKLNHDLIDEVRIYLTGKQPKLRAAAFRLWTTLCRTASTRHRQYPPPGISKASAPVRHRQCPPPGILKGSAPVRHRQYPPPGIPKASAPVNHQQYPPPGISKTSAPIRLHQYPPKGTPKGSPPVCLRQYPPPGIPKPSAPVHLRQYSSPREPTASASDHLRQ
ncbi:hypothetical protein PoB_006123200 [Plakobranchus ocellatus]|uniref:Uncharacterized protein n=1 Tax=Plakobranchus ocellatus TaxID=259542 RepID=A0AAV4CS69_9GAST|nr:hypothetical protein PoB_006123200 [Plakobranchus ocellatus]